jgi:hypothetical protein
MTDIFAAIYFDKYQKQHVETNIRCFREVFSNFRQTKNWTGHKL